MAEYDIALVGGGLTGVALAGLLKARGKSVVHFAPAMEKDYRTSALMMPTVEFLAQSGLCEDPDSLGYPLRQIRIIDATQRLLRSPEALFDSKEIGREQFGYNFPNADLLAHFQQVGEGKDGHIDQIDARVGLIERKDDLFVITDSHQQEHHARLLVGADGKKSMVRQHFGFAYDEEPFEQSALVCDFEFERSIGDCSIEFHYENGPFTLVPAHNNKINLVWLDRHKVLNDTMGLSDDQFEQLLAEKAHHLFGHAKLLSKRFVFPLTNIHMRTAGKDGVVLVGEAAHAFPPIGAQGLNLGLRDVESFIEALDEVAPAGTPISAAAARKISDRYAAKRTADLIKTSGFVDGLFKSLLSDFLPAQALRLSGLWALKTMQPLRKLAFKIGMGR
ncbi:FAD-dependent monooxygenase [Maritalea myrionectae]|uniref:FAD-dependent monooxygenase n=1 Tax=Maritalea myrionectae TaxID=454601 RepID=UPI0004055349|nr:FAD-dependent monooxygenase [Maritalea myrionectae]